LGTGPIAPSRKKPIIKKVDRRKRKIKDLQMATWNVRSLYRLTGLCITINELKKYKIVTPQAFGNNGYNIYTSSLSNKHEFGTAFQVNSKHNQLVMNFTPIKECLCILRVKGRFFKHSLINIHAPTNDSDDEANTEPKL
jgi:hypothetical protein